MPDFTMDFDGGYRLAGTLNLTVPPPPEPPPPTLLGVDCSAADLPGDLATYPRMAYHRVFSGNTLPSLTTGKLATLPKTCIPHVSWKLWDLPVLDAWLGQLTRPVYLTYWHEPMGNISPEVYQIRGGMLADACKGHPLVLGNGPILTRYWLDDTKGDPDLWWYEGLTLFGIDTYHPWRDAYRGPETMFGTGVELGQRYGVPVLFPEWGVERIPTDTAGAGRAALLRDSWTYLRDNHVRAAGWWNIGGDRLAAHPELATMQTLVAVQ